jgi:hypothetical protein
MSLIALDAAAVYCVYVYVGRDSWRLAVKCRNNLNISDHTQVHTTQRE